MFRIFANLTIGQRIAAICFSAIGGVVGISLCSGQNPILTIVIILLTVVIVGGLSVLTWRQITGALGNMGNVMSKLSEGDTSVQVPEANRTDEMGAIAKALLILKQNMILADERSEMHHQEAHIMEAQRKSMDAFVSEVGVMVTAASKGDLSARLSVEDADESLKTVRECLNELVATVETGLDETVSVISALSEGKLDQRMVKNYQGAFDRLKRDSNAMADKLSEIVSGITEATDSVAASAREISQGSQDLSARTEHQANSLENTSSAMEELTATVHTNADNAKQANQLSDSARTAAVNGGVIVSDAVGAMSRIQESSGKISDIVNVIDEIAFQTNLLALNAAVEAARAGEAGKGFAVVAQEVRALAQRSSEASGEVKKLIGNSNKEVKQGVELVNKTGVTLNEIVESVKRVADIVSEISSASQEQAHGLDDVNVAVSKMDESVQKNASLVEETTAASGSLESQAEVLIRLLSFFGEGQDNRRNIEIPLKAVQKAVQGRQDNLTLHAPPTQPDSKDDDWEEF